MDKPSFSLGQQIVASIGGTQYMAKIEAAQVIQGIWKYGVRVQPKNEHLAYVANSDIKYYLHEGKWNANSSKKIA